VAVTTRSFKRYPSYRDSGVEWLREIPSHWEVKRLRSTLTSCQNGVWGDEPDGVRDVVCVRVADFDRVGFRVEIADPTLRSIDPGVVAARGLHRGDLLLEKSGGGENQPVGAVVLYDHTAPAVCSNFVARVKIAERHDARFLTFLHAALYALRVNTRHIKQSTGIQNLDSASYLSESTGLPPEPEQCAIAAFLDRETTRIDQLIAKKERQIELLQEKRSALISHAVTKGLNPKAKMKDSGIEWLGEIPEHWDVFRSKVVFAEINDRSDTGAEELLSVSHITGVTPRSEKEVNMFMAESMAGYKKCKRNDLVVNTMWAWMGAMGIAFHDGIVSPSYNTYRFRSSAIEPRYYDFLFRTRQFISEVICCSKGVWQSRLRLYPEEFFGIRVPCPPSDEQRKIVIYIDQQTGYIEEMRRKIEKSIGMLREYRTVLISAAVTGKIDVREEVA